GGQADDAHGIATNIKSLAEWILSWKDIVLDVGADDRDVGGMFLLDFGEEPSRFEIHPEHRLHVRGVSLNLHVGHFLLPQMYRLDNIGLSADGRAGTAFSLDQPRLAQGDGFALAGQDELLAAPNDSVLCKDEDVRVQVQDLVANISIQTADDRHDRHDRRYTDDDSQKSQEGSELVAPKRLERDVKKLLEAHFSLFSPPFFSFSTLTRSPSLSAHRTLNGPVRIS